MTELVVGSVRALPSGPYAKEPLSQCIVRGVQDRLDVVQRQLDLAWAAGFLDGEGCFTLSKQSGPTHPSQRALHVSASQTRREPLDKLQGLFGGKVKEHSRTTEKGTVIWVWILGQRSSVVQEFIPQVLPYLVVKKREAEILLEFAATVRFRGRPKAGVDHLNPAEVAIREALISELNDIRGR